MFTNGGSAIKSNSRLKGKLVFILSYCIQQQNVFEFTSKVPYLIVAGKVWLE